MEDWLEQASGNLKPPRQPGDPWLVDASKKLEKSKSLEYGTQQNPQNYSSVLNASKSMGIDVDFALRNKDEILRIHKQSEIQKKISDTQALKKHFQDPDFASIAHNDVDALTKIERTAKALGVGAVQATLGISESIWRTPETIGRFLDATNKGMGINYLSEKLKEKGAPEWLTGTGGTFQKLIGDTLKTTQIADKIKESQEILGEEFESFRRIQEKGLVADKAFSSALKGDISPLGQVLTDPEMWTGFIGQAAPSLYTAYKSGGSLPFIAWLESMEVANDAAEFEKKTGQKIDPVKFAQAVGQVALINTFLEKFGLDQVFGQAGKGTLSGLIKGAISEGGTEGLQQFNTNIATYLAYDPTKNLAEGVLGSIMGGVGTGGPAGALSAVSGPNSEFAKKISHAQKAFNDQDKLNNAVENAKESTVRTDNPEKYKAFLDDVLGAENFVYIPAEDAIAFFQSNPKVMENFPENVKESIQEAIETRGDVGISKADYLTYLSDYHEELADSLRNDQDGMNVKEADEWLKESSQEFEKEANKILENMDQESEFNLSADRVQKTIKDEIVKTGRITEEVADKYAQLHKAFAVTMADKLKTTPEEVYNRLGLKVQGAPIAGEALQQADYRIQHKPMTSEQGAANLDDLTIAFGEDIYTKNALQYFGSGDKREAKIVKLLQGLRGKSDAKVKIYRGAPEGINNINPGDWVTLDKEVAKEYGPAVIEKEVSVKDVTAWADSLLEFGYFPEGEVLYQQAKKITQTPEFAAWFKDSKVVDENGEPLVVYHGTTSNLESFSKKLLGENTGAASAKEGFFFVSDAFTAGQYSVPGENKLLPRSQQERTSLVNEWYESLDNKIDEIVKEKKTTRHDFFKTKEGKYYSNELERTASLDELQSDFSENANIVPVYLSISNPLIVDFQGKMYREKSYYQIINDAKKSGNDGVILRNTYDPGIFGIREEPSDIYVVFEPTQIKSIFNQGTFDPKDERILYQGSLFPESNRLSNINKKGGMWNAIKENNPGIPESGDIIIYRATIGNEIRENDYVAINPKIAKEHLSNLKDRGEKGKIIKLKVNVSDLLMANDATEFVYSPILKQEKRGQIQFTDDAKIITLLENADLSTFLHESGHFFFEAYKDLAGESPEIAQDMQSLLEFIGIDSLETWNAMSLEERRAGHEKVAEAFERYLFEGKAPNLEIQSLFQRFRDWLVNVYKNLRVSLSDDVRGVFDRMLATDEMIRQTQVARAYEPLFGQQEGMTELQWKEYQDLNKLRDAKAKSELDRKSLRDMQWLENAKNKTLKALQRENKAKRLEVKDEVSKDVSRETIYRAMNFLKKGELNGLTFEDHRLDYDTLERMYEGAKSPKDQLVPEIDELLVAIAKVGGLDMQEAEAQGIDPENWKGRNALTINQPIVGKRLFRADGLSFDEMARALSQYGYTESTPNALLDKIEKTLAGTQQYSVGVDYDLINPPYEPVNWRELSMGKYGMMAKNGLHPDIVAEQFGFTSGDELVRKLLDAEKIKDRIERLTDQRMLEKYGDITSPEALERAVNEALHNDAHTRFLHTELTQLTKRTGSRNVLARAAKAFAEQAISRKKVRDIKPAQYTAAEARAAKNAEKALGKGDRDSATEHKRAQVLNNHFFRAANNAQNEIDKAIRYFKKFAKEGTRKKLDIDYLDQIDSLLESYEFKKVSLKELERRKSLKKWIEEQQAQGFEPIVEEPTGKKNYKDATYEELMGLKGSIRNIEHLGRLKNKLLKQKEHRELMQTADTIGQSIRDNSTGKNKDKIETNSWLDRAIKGKNEFFAMHRKFASLARQMDGFKEGPLWDYIIRPMNQSGDFEAVEREKATVNLHDIFKPLMKMRLREKRFIPGIGKSLSREGRIMIGLNWGNETNRKRVMDGEGWSPEQAQAILDTLSKQEWEFIQNTWNFIDQYWPQISEKEQRVSGVAPEKVDRAPVQTRYGEYEGGYFPIKYDADRSARAEADSLAEVTKQMMEGFYTRATTRRGHTKARVDTVKNRPIRKDFGVIFEHVDQVIHDLAWHEWLIDTNRLLRTEQIDSAMRERYGPEVVRTIKKAVEDIASGDIPAQNVWERSINWVRTGTSISGMGWNLWTSLLQPLGLTQSMVRIGPKWVGRGLAEWFKGAAHMEKTVANIYEKSPFMRLRGKTLQREINEIRNKVSSGGKLPVIQDTYFYLIQKTQMIADIPTWLGAYYKAIEEGNMEDRAVALADQAVLDAQGGGQVKDLAQIQRGSPMFKLWTNFYSFFNTTYNLTAESFRRTKSPAQIGRLAVDLMLLYIVPATISALMREAFKDECKGDEDCMVEKVIRENVDYMTGTMVGLRDITAFTSGFDYTGPAGLRFFNEVNKLGKQIEQGEVDRAMLKALNSTGGILFHYPAGQVQRAVEGFYAISEGEVEGPRAVVAPLTGPPK